MTKPMMPALLTTSKHWVAGLLALLCVLAGGEHVYAQSADARACTRSPTRFSKCKAACQQNHPDSCRSAGWFTLMHGSKKAADALPFYQKACNLLHAAAMPASKMNKAQLARIRSAASHCASLASHYWQGYRALRKNPREAAKWLRMVCPLQPSARDKLVLPHLWNHSDIPARACALLAKFHATGVDGKVRVHLGARYAAKACEKTAKQRPHGPYSGTTYQCYNAGHLFLRLHRWALAKRYLSKGCNFKLTRIDIRSKKYQTKSCAALVLVKAKKVR